VARVSCLRETSINCVEMVADLDRTVEDADRHTLRRYVGSVTIRSCGMGRAVPVEQRVEVRWADGSEPSIPSLADLAKAAAAKELIGVS